MYKTIKASTENITLDDVYNVLEPYAGKWKNPKTGWEGESVIFQKNLDDGSYLFTIYFDGDSEGQPDLVLYAPNRTDKPIFTVIPYSGEMQWVDTLDELRRALRKEYSYLQKVNASTKTKKRRVTAAYGGWSKFYGLPDVEFTVPNDMDDPTIFYDGKYYNYYDVEDILWDMFKEYCEDTGVIQDEDMFEQWVSENPDEVYSILSEIQPKKSRGRGVRRDGEMYASASHRSSGRRVMAARNAKKIEVYVVQEYTGYGNGWEDIAQYPDTSSDSLRQAKQDVKDYRDNGYSARIITRRVDNPDYVEPANEITYDEAVAWVESCPYDVRESYFSAGKNYVLMYKGKRWAFAQVFIDEDNTVSVRNISGNRTKQVRSIAELEKEVNRLANL